MIPIVLERGENMTKTMTKKELPYRYQMLADILPVGKQNAITLDTIMKLCDIKEKRNAYEIVERLIIEHGYVILASRKGEFKGYFIPENEAEFKENVKPFIQSIQSMNRRHNALLENFYGG